MKKIFFILIISLFLINLRSYKNVTLNKTTKVVKKTLIVIKKVTKNTIKSTIKNTKHIVKKIDNSIEKEEIVKELENITNGV